MSREYKPPKTKEMNPRDRFELPEVRVRVRTFEIPLIRDVAVIGLAAPVNRVVMIKILGMMTPERFVGRDIRDPIVKSIVAREAVIRKIGWPMLIKIVRRDITRLMAKSEIVGLKLEIEVALAECSLT